MTKNALRVWRLSAGPGQVDLEPVSLPGEVQTLDEASLNLPGGAYTTLRTYASCKLLRFSEHVHRLAETAQLAGQELHVDEQNLRLALRNLLAGNQEGKDFRIRLTLDLERLPGDIYFALEPLVVPPPAAYQQGVRVITCDYQRQMPKAKLTRFIDRSRPLRRSLPPEVNEAVMVNAQGQFLEGLSSNFFAVLEGTIWTAEQGVLSGITRGIVIECACSMGLPFHNEAPRREDIHRFDEVLITSSSRGVLPVCQIDQTRIGARCPGPVTRRLIEAFETFLEDHLEPI